MKVTNISLPPGLSPHPSWDIIDSTKIKAFMQCPRMFFYEYVLGWRPGRPSNHLVFGKAVHKALEHITLHGYTANNIIDAIELFNDEYRADFPESTDLLYEPKTPARFFEMLVEYVKTYAEDMKRYEVYKTEIGGTIPVSDSHTVAFKMDTIVYDTYTNKYCSLEHKTKGGNYIGDTYVYDFMLSPQVGTYTHVLNAIFPRHEVGDIIINCLCMKKTKKPEFIFGRYPIPMSDQNMETWLTNINSWIDSIERNFYLLEESNNSSTLFAFPLNPCACTNWARTCTYFDLCRSWPNPLHHLDSMPLDMKTEFWNPLEEELTHKVTL